MNAAQLIVISDLDGTLLDAETYGYDASLPAVRRLQALSIPLVLCSSKTRKEIEHLSRELGIQDPFICENGGAVCFPKGYFPFPVGDAKVRDHLEIIAFGTEVRVLRRALKESARALGLRVRSFGGMNTAEVSQLTGLPRAQASWALQREYDEAFVVEGKDAKRLFEVLRNRGLVVTFGGRLYHLTGGHDKGRAVSYLLRLLRKIHPDGVSVGLGNSENDLPLLREVDRPILVRNADGSYDQAVLQAMPKIQKTLESGPAGWNDAITKMLAESSLPGR